MRMRMVQSDEVEYKDGGCTYIRMGGGRDHRRRTISCWSRIISRTSTESPLTSRRCHNASINSRVWRRLPYVSFNP